MQASEQAMTAVAARPSVTTGRAKPPTTARSRLAGAFAGPNQLGVLLLYALVICGVYSAVLIIKYGFTDDYLYLYASLSGQMRAADSDIISGGRPLYALLLSVTLAQFNHIRDLWVLRLDSLLGIALFAWIFYQALLRTGMQQVIALLVPLLVTTLPAYQVFAGWSVTAFFPYSAAFAGMSVLLADRAFTAVGARRFVMWLGVLVLQLISMTIYQPTAMLFWLFAAVVLFVPEHPLDAIIRRLAALLAVMAFSLLCDFGLSKVLPVLLYTHPVYYARVGLADNVGSKLQFFLQPLFESLNLFHLVDKSNKTQLLISVVIALAVGVLIITGLPRYFTGSRRTRWQKTIVALGIIPFAYLPNLLVAENFGSYRSQVAMSSLIALYVVIGALGYARSRPEMKLPVVPVVLLLLTIASMGYALRDTSTQIAIPQQEEYQVVLAQVRAAPLSKITIIYGVPSLVTDRLSGDAHHDEFGLPTTSIYWYIEPVIWLAIYDVAPQYFDRIDVIETAVPPPRPGPGVWVINMHTVLQQLHR